MKRFFLSIFLKLADFYEFIKPFKDNRLNAFVFISVLIVGVFTFRLLSLTVFEKEKWLSLVKKQFQGAIKLSSERGTIYDRNYSPFAISVKVFSIYIRPTEIKDKLLMKKILLRDPAVLSRYSKDVEKLKKLLEPLSVIKEEDIDRAYEKKFTNGVPFVWLKKSINTSQIPLFRSINLALKIYYRLSGENKFRKRYPDLIGAVKEYKRKYPMETGICVVGLTTPEGEGLSGLEYYLEKKNIITGKTTFLKGEKDATGKVYLGENVLQFVKKEKGNNVIISIDANLQYIFEKVLEEYGAKLLPNFINAVLIDANNGDILAMATYPPTTVPRFITTPYEPGSVIKPFVLASALNEGLIGVNDVIFSPAKYPFGGKVFHNEFGKDLKIRAWEVIQHSDNVGIIKIAQMLGKEKLYQYLKKFGFGEKTGVELAGESKGILRNWKKWKDVDFATISFGHNISTTTLQLASAFAVLVNGGYKVKPRLLLKVVDDKLQTIKVFPPIKERVLSEEVSKIMRRVLTMVVEGGTGTATRLSNFYVAGKTGTARKWDPALGDYNPLKITASFVGAFPATNPQYVLAVTVDEPRVEKESLWASKTAVPLFRELAERVILYERLKPDKVSYELLDSGEIRKVPVNENFTFKNPLVKKGLF